MNSKLIFLIAAVAIGVGVYGLIQPASAPAPKRAVVEEQPKEPTFRVYLTKQSLAKGEPISTSQLEIEHWPQSKANQSGIDQDQVLPTSTTLLARNDIPAQSIIYLTDIVTEQSPDYLDFATAPGKVPFPIQIDSGSVVGGVVRNGTQVDVLALASTQQNLANDSTVGNFRGVSLTPVLMGIKVLKVEQLTETNKKDVKSTKTTLVLELSSKQVATITIAKHIAQLEVHKSLAGTEAKDLSANAGDVLENYRAIKEFRAGDIIVK
ncbi:Flp pilus assembly protein CpaB [Methylophaga thalassica]|uniref:Flp pilus assembly protein CpaB n=1 Tax=Methylophaga aminisulfidivorans TaxID=230105 RepID=UPI003A942D3E